MNGSEPFPALLVTLLVVAYLLIGVTLGRLHYRRRHGVRLGRGEGVLNSGFLTAYAVACGWPIAIFKESVRNPEPCDHPHHVLERSRARRAHEATRAELRAALEEERGHR